MNEISREFCLASFSEGVKLLAPDDKKYRAELRLDNILRSEFPVYLEDPENVSLMSNEATAVACGFASLKDFVGKPAFKYFKAESISEKLSNHKSVIRDRVRMIAEESGVLKDGDVLNTLSVRMPWYNDANEVLGLFGCSIVIGLNPLADSLKKIANLGLLNTPHSSREILPKIGIELGSAYLSRRELQCLKLTIRGMPAKEAAFELGLSRRTVEEYLNNIKRKLNVTTKGAMIEKTVNYLSTVEIDRPSKS
jgi:DNA-binding CsgD family transcriptional regulator